MKEKLAVIVGGTGQIGKGIIKAFHKEEYLTVCISATETLGMEKNPYTEYCVYDMSRPELIEACCTTVAKKHKKIDVLVNALGKNRGGSLYDISEEMWDDVVDSNMKSVFFICRTFAKLLESDGGGSMINVASTAGIRALPKSPHYIAAKAGVIALTEYFAQTLAPLVRVNCIAPGFVLTENHKPENYANYDDVTNRLPLRRMTTIEEIAEAIVFLANSKTITGHTLVVDGGLIL
jgi:3-oxoacyl-[acyl-carrier protein] reductase